MALVLTRVFWRQFQSTPFLLSFTAVVLSSRLGGREAGFAAVVFGVVWYTAFPPPLHGTSYVGLLVGFTLISTAFSWIVAKHSEIADALRASEARLAAAPYGVRTIDRLARSRHAGRAIVEEAERRQAEIIVLGAPRGLHRDIFGKTVDYVLKNAPCRVMVAAGKKAA